MRVGLEAQQLNHLNQAIKEITGLEILVAEEIITEIQVKVLKAEAAVVPAQLVIQEVPILVEMEEQVDNMQFQVQMFITPAEVQVADMQMMVQVQAA